MGYQLWTTENPPTSFQKSCKLVMMAVFGNVMPTDMYTDTNASGKSIVSVFRIVFIDILGQNPLQRWYMFLRPPRVTSQTTGLHTSTILTTSYFATAAYIFLLTTGIIKAVNYPLRFIPLAAQTFGSLKFM